jgi:hypothetical protein
VVQNERSPQTETVPLTVSFPKAVYDRIRTLAHDQRRSLSNTVVWLTTLGLAEVDGAGKPGASA